MFSPKFLQKMLFCDASCRSEHRQLRACGILSQDRIHCLCPWGEDAVSPSPDCSGCSGPLPCRASSPMSQVQSTHLHAGVTQACLFAWEVRGHRAECEPGFSGGKGVGRTAAAGLSQTRWDCTSTHSDLLVSHGAPPRTLTCCFPMVHLHALWPAAFPWYRFQLFSVRIPGWPISPHTLGVHVSSLEFSMTFSLSSLAPRLLVLTFNLPFDTSGVSCQHKQ